MRGVKEISVFVDESGSFVPESVDKASRHYLLCMVFHDQSSSIAEDVKRLEDSLETFGLPRHHCLHAGPLIRREQDYANMTREERRGLMRRIFIFFDKSSATYRCFKIDKHFNTADTAIHDTLLQEIVAFLVSRRNEFNGFEKIKVYYDRGQEQVTKLLKEAFAIYSSKVEWESDVKPEKYRLFQAADLVCTLELVRTKLETEGRISNSEYAFFGGISRLEKNVSQAALTQAPFLICFDSPSLIPHFSFDPLLYCPIDKCVMRLSLTSCRGEVFRLYYPKVSFPKPFLRPRMRLR